MSNVLRGSLLLIAFAAIAPQPAQAQLFRQLFDDCCVKCQQPMCSCTCSTIEPIVETCYRQERCVNWRDVQCTGTRTETYCETVPVQKYHNITVDEGCWKMVWCPKPVCKTVCTTEYQQRLACRNVPYTYIKKVPEVTTRVVPQQTVRYVEKKTFTCTRPVSGRMPICPPQPTCTTPAPAPCPTCPQPQTTFAPPTCAVPGAQAAVAQPNHWMAQTNPQTGLVPQPQHLDTPQATTVDQWTLVPTRNAAAGPAVAPANPYPIQPVAAPPSAATLWQNRPAVKPF